MKADVYKITEYIRCIIKLDFICNNKNINKSKLSLIKLFNFVFWYYFFNFDVMAVLLSFRISFSCLASSWKEYHVDLMVLHKHKKLHVIILRFILQGVVAKNRQKRYARFKSYTGRICFWKQVFAMATTRVIFWHRAKPILIFLAHLAKDDVSFCHHFFFQSFIQSRYKSYI